MRSADGVMDEWGSPRPKAGGVPAQSGTGAEGSVAEVTRRRWGVALGGPFPARFSEPGWSYEERVGHRCPVCEGELHALRRPYASQGRVYRYTALICPACPTAFSLADLGVKTYDQLTAVPSASVPEPPRPCPGGTGGTVTAIRVPGRLPAAVREGPRPAWPEDLAVPEQAGKRALLWCKVTDPAWRPAEEALAAADDVRVILPEGPEYDALRGRLAEHGVPHRVSRYWEEAEQVGTVNESGGCTDLVAVGPGGAVPAAGPWAAAARDAFAAQWDALEELPEGDGGAYVPVEELVPAEWAALLPHPSFNPAQAAAVPVVREGTGHLVVVAPTGAGKTPIGMVAALQAHAGGRKADWLVPQRSLTDELDRELQLWRRRGLRVVRLTGEAAVDTELIRAADVWVATTEKFEAICRAGSLRDALAEVGCLVVDEIHLLGDPARGAVLEALLTRVRKGSDSTGTRIIGLSATVANADEVAEWLGARLVRTAWRPTRLTWQLPVLPLADEADWAARAAVRTEAAVRIAREVTADGGSVLVFCGSKRRVRATALALAADRGVATAGVDADDAEEVERLCTKAGVRLHYRDWPYKREAEQVFRARAADILVATSTVAAGVNLPARAVIVSDTSIGLDRIEVSMVQQMFGRAGRIGAGEREGWAFLLADPAERAHWQARLAAGYTVRSRLGDHLPDHLLSEAVQERVSTAQETEAWWAGTFAAHQGEDGVEPLREAARFLTASGCLRVTADEGRWETSPLGRLTSRFMVDATLADDLATAVRESPVPEDAFTAERLLAALFSTGLPVLEQAPFTDRARTALRRVLRETDHEHGEPEESDAPAEDEPRPEAGDLARAVLHLVADRPALFRGRPGYVLGIPVDSMTGILDEAQRYLAWLGAQGPLGTVHPWAAVVAGDLAQRIRWRTLGPGRGAGRLLWMCERMATAPLAPDLVPRMWRAARARGIDAPDWSGTTPPSDCALPPDRYRALLAERATGVHLALQADTVHVTAPPGSVIRLWNGATTTLHIADGEATTLLLPPDDPSDPSAGRGGAAVFTRGDRLGTGWLGAYAAIRL
ncbi:DEAD/DEAH box helicase [Streptomyces ipomoeae]|uniref:DEAD/DEAH box helicase n=1 Tax=Streptomyces ipomoeae TaxID=103232 RepID=UPI0029B7692C|nr:DEAD/DEAH box helicase [Streptomyces ipomoeae]MDX2819982.1 DEAD/DEAH box helicase [Streptomyces ipomoeae]MDX2872501.1 DEAD/DEAH box helicase [Streptomyces ipomoeae]